MNVFLNQLGIEHPIIQAPMAGVSTPELAAAVSNNGGLGSIAIGAVDVVRARADILTLRTLTSKPFNVNVFTHKPAHPDSAREQNWIEALRPCFEVYGAHPPTTLKSIYKSFDEDRDMLDLLVESAPAVVSFHFGLPDQSFIAALKAANITLFASVTSIAEANAAQRAGVDVLVAQGFEAGGHRGVFDPAAFDACLSTYELTAQLVKECDLPVIAAGGVMSGADIVAVLDLGAVAAQLGSAFICCPESSASAPHRAALLNPQAATTMTTAISGRPARCLVNDFTRFGDEHNDVPRPDYPIAYDAGKALNAAAGAKGHFGYGAHWAGQGATHARSLPAATLMQTLVAEMRSASTAR